MATVQSKKAMEELIPPVSFVVTGFGPFRGVPQNPTTVVVEELMEHLMQQERDASTQLSTMAPLSSVTKTVVLETAADSVKTNLDKLYRQTNGDVPFNSQQERGDDAVCCDIEAEKLPVAPVMVVLHLGVNYRGQAFQIERFGYNEATFRIPDECGYQPWKKCVVDSRKYGQRLETVLDVERLRQDILGMGFDSDGAVVVSTDPGRFVCNYTYCYSLDKCNAINGTTSACRSDVGPSHHGVSVVSLFLHVPPFKVESKERQLDFVVKLMEAIRLQLVSQNLGDFDG